MLLYILSCFALLCNDLSVFEQRIWQPGEKFLPVLNFFGTTKLWT